MHLNKDIIVRVILSLVFLVIAGGVFLPMILIVFKGKVSGSDNEDDIDHLIKRQKERLRSQYGIKDTPGTSPFDHVSPAAQKIFQETQWGGGALVKEIQFEINKNYSYTVAESKINAFILLCEKRNYLQYLSNENQAISLAVKNYLIILLLFFLLIEEIREKKFFIMETISHKIGINSQELALALQIKLLLSASSKKVIKEERIFCDSLAIHQYAEETIREASETIAKREANLWAKSPSQFFEELSLALSYSSILTPLPKLKNKKDFETACSILSVSSHQPLQEIKKQYKKIALLKHPDKIVSQKLPKTLEKISIEKYNQIQEAYELIVKIKSKQI